MEAVKRRIVNFSKTKFFPNLRKITIICSAFALAALVFLWWNNGKTWAAPWSALHNNWAKRKQLTLTNNSGATLNANTTYQISINTKELYDGRSLKANCDDIRVVYQPDSSTNTELKRSISYAQGSTNCSDSTATTIFFPLQAAITNNSSTSNYYIYYSNPNAPAYTAADSLAAYNVGNKAATFVAPFMGTTTALAAGTGVPSTATGAIRYSGAKSALEFNGKADDVDTGNFTGTYIGNASTSFTIEAWVKPQYENSTSYWTSGYILGGDANTTGCGGNQGPIYTEFLSTTQRRFVFSLAHSATDTCQSDNTIYFNAFDTDPFQYNTWYNLTATYDASTKIMKTYLNGVFYQQTTWTGANTITWNNNLHIGSKNGSSYFHGDIDEIRISNVVRYSANFTPQTTPFVRDANTKLLYHFDENGNDPRQSGKIIDDSGNNYHGTINGAPNYISGLIGVDSSSSTSGRIPVQSFASHQGIFIEEGTTNKITNPSFENSTAYATGWSAAGSNLTATLNTSPLYNKFGSQSEKLVANASAISGTSNSRTININAGNTNTHTLSFYVYDVTSGNIGGTVSSSIIKPVFKGTAQNTGTYTNMGGGWWRVSYSAAAANSAQEYGVEVQVSKTVYIDGVQLEQLGYATSYTDGSLGSNYSWSGTTDNSTSTRSTSVLNYSNTNNISANNGTITFWAKRNTTKTISSSEYQFMWGDSITSYIAIYYYDPNDIRFEFKQNNTNIICGTSGIFTGIDPKNWHHFALTWKANSGGSDTCQIYTDGAAYGTGPTNQSWTFNPTGNLYIGSNTSTLQQGNSILSDFKIYNNSLSSTEVADLYNAGLGAHSEGAEIQKDKPMLYWKFDEGSGTTAQDSSGNSLTGTISNATYDPLTTSDKNNNQFALKFNGTSAYVSRPYSSDTKLDPGTDSFSISSWFKHSSTAPNSGTHTLVSRYNSGGYKIYMNTSGYMCFGIDSDNTWTPSHAACSSAAQGSYADSKWHHIESTKDAVNNKLTLYIDGVIVNQQTITDTASLTGSSPTFYVGVDSNGSSNYWTGYIDDVKYFGVIRSASQVETDMLARGAVKGITANIADQGGLASGLVGYWKMDESSGTVADSSGNGSTGTWGGTGSSHYSTGLFGNGGGFNGSDDYINLNSPASLTDQSSYTATAWIYANSFGQNSLGRIFDKDTLPAAGWGLFVDNAFCSGGGNRLTYINHWSAGSGSGGRATWCTGTNTITTGRWIHVAVTYDSRSPRNTPTIYINGKQMTLTNTETPGGTIISDSAHNLYIGNRPNTDRTFDGKIDEARIYNRILSPAEISQLYNWAPGPVAHYTFDEGNGSSVNDMSGNGNAGNWGGSGNHWKNGKYGKAGNFNGTDDKVTVSSNFMGNQGTISGWFYNSSIPNNNLSYVSQQRIGGNDSMDLGASNDYGTKTYAFRIFDTNNSWNTSFTPINTATPNKWMYITATWQVGSPINIYVNGVLSCGTCATLSYSPKSAINFSIGFNNENTSYHAGLIDELSVYNYVRSSKQIVEDMNAGHPSISSALEAPLVHWKMDERANDTCGGGTNDACNSGSGGNVYDGAESSTTVTLSGKYNAARTFTGSSSISAGDQSFVNSLAGMSISLWIKPSALATSKEIIGKWTSGQTHFQVITDSSTSSEIRVYISSNGGTDTGSNYCTTSGLGLTTAVWQQLIITYDGTATTGNNIAVYNNGRTVTCTVSGTIPATLTSVDTTSALKLGNYNTAGAALNSDYDDLKIYTYPITSDQVKVDYNNSKSMMLGSVSTNADGSSSSSAVRAYCPPGNTEGRCAAGQNPAPGGEWKFDDNPGTFKDTSGNNNNASRIPVYPQTDYFTKQRGIKNQAIYYDGQFTYISVPDNATLEGGSQLTYETWVNLVTDSLLASKWNSFNFSWQFLTSNGELKLYVDPDGMPTGNSCTANSVGAGLKFNNWYHLAFSFNNNSVKFYVNGKPVNTTITGTCNSMFDSSIELMFGGASGYPSGTLIIDDSVLFTYERTPAQIEWDYNKGKPLLNWKLDECTGTAIHDSAENGNDATLTIGATGYQTSAGSCTSADTATAWYNGKDGKYNGSISFDGSDDYIVNTGSDVFDNLTTDGTLSAWVKLRSDAATGYNQVLNYGSGCGGLNQNEFELALDKINSNSARFAIWATTGSNPGCGANLIEGYTPPINNPYSWHHIVYTSNSSGNKFYVDGVQQSVSYTTGTSSTGAFLGGSSAGTSKLYSGRAADGSESFRGQVDDLRVYNYALSAKQVMLLYNAGVAARFTP